MSSFVLTIEPPPLVRFLTPYAEGAGSDWAKVEERVRKLLEDYHDSVAITDREAVLAEDFRSLAEEWRQATRFQSSLTRITEHPAYRAVVQLGEEVVPLILRELRRQPEPWFTALGEITGANPVRPEHRGDMRAMADAWLRWGRSHGFIR